MEETNENMTCGNSRNSQYQVEFYQDFNWWVGGVLSIFTSVLGIILNTISICVLCNRRIRASLFNRLLVCLAIMDSLFLAATIFDALTRKLITLYSFHHVFIFVHILYPARSMLICSSTYMTVGLSYERYAFLTKPIHQRARHNTNTYSRLALYCSLIITFSILYYIPRFFDLELEKLPCSKNSEEVNGTLFNCSEQYDFRPTPIRINPNYVLWYINVSNLVVTGVIPGVLLGFFNYKISKSLQRSNQTRASMVSRQRSTAAKQQNKNNSDHGRTLVLFAIVILFFVCHALRIILNIEEVANLASEGDPKIESCPILRFWAVVLIPVSNLLIQVNASANFFIYCFCDRVFKEVLVSQLSIKYSFPTRTSRTQESFKLSEFV